MERSKGGKTDRKTDGQIYGQTDRVSDGQTGRQNDRLLNFKVTDKDYSKLEAHVNEMFAKLLSQKSLTNVKIFKQIGYRLDKVVYKIE